MILADFQPCHQICALQYVYNGLLAQPPCTDMPLCVQSVMLTVQTGFLGALRHSHKDDTSMCRLLNISVASSSNTHLSVFRGYKVVVKFFPNEAANLEPVVELLLKIEEEVCPSVTALHCIALHCIHSPWQMSMKCAPQLMLTSSPVPDTFKDMLPGVPKQTSCNRTPKQN